MFVWLIEEEDAAAIVLTQQDRNPSKGKAALTIVFFTRCISIPCLCAKVVTKSKPKSPRFGPLSLVALDGPSSTTEPLRESYVASALPSAIRLVSSASAATRRSVPCFALHL
jgi:hypothetical protein